MIGNNWCGAPAQAYGKTVDNVRRLEVLTYDGVRQGVLPAVRAAAPGSLLLADGFSCRTQIEQGDTGRRALHLAEVLALGLEGTLPAEHPERLAARPDRPSRAARWATTAGATALAATAATAACRAALRSLRRP